MDLAYDLFVILAAGLISGVVSKRLGFSMLAGYLLAGAVIGRGGLGLIAENGEDIEHLAHFGALLLLFAIGIEFSLEELVRLSRYFFIGGSVQMTLVGVPVSLVCVAFGADWRSSVLIGWATALSSTVLVFRALAEWGETASPQGRRAIGILLFQDVALVPMILLMPLLTVGEDRPPLDAYLFLAVNSLLFVAAVLALRRLLMWWLVPLLSDLRSVELVVLFALITLAGFCLGARAAGLPPALGAFAAGLVLGGNRLTGQIDALILPYRESFGVVFFISLGTLLDPSVLAQEPTLLILALVAVLAVKTGAATVALRLTGLPWHAAAGMGLGLAQMGELSFVLLSEGLHTSSISKLDYERMLLLAIGTLILTPPLLKLGFLWTRRWPSTGHMAEDQGRPPSPAPEEAVIIGLGPMGRQAASQLEIMGVDVCLIDLSPVNLYAHAQQGFRTVSGDARDAEVLDRADAAECRLAIVCVPEDRIATQIVKVLRTRNPDCTIIVRCRYQSHAAALKRVGAHTVVSEEAEASLALLRLLQRMEEQTPGETH